MGKLNLTKTELGNLIHNPELTLVIGCRDYMKEALADCITLQFELEGIRKTMINAIHEIQTKGRSVHTMTGIGYVMGVLRKYGLIEEEE